MILFEILDSMRIGCNLLMFIYLDDRPESLEKFFAKETYVGLQFERFLYKNFFRELNSFAIFESFSKSYSNSCFRNFCSMLCILENIVFENIFFDHNFSKTLVTCMIAKIFYREIVFSKTWNLSQSCEKKDLEKLTKRHVLDKIFIENILSTFSKSLTYIWLR